MYTYYDHKSQAYDVPFFAKDDIHAKRKFYLDCTAKANAVIANFTEDFDLLAIGEYDLREGDFTKKNRLLATGKDMKQMIVSAKGDN